MFEEKELSTIEEYQKSQLVRVFDIILVGPFLILVATYTTLPKTIRAILFFLGLSTIIYNGNNYLKNLKNN